MNHLASRRALLAAASFALLAAPVLAIVASGHSVFENDEACALALIQSGEAHTLILSRPLTSLLIGLYSLAPLVPWFSGLVAALLLGLAAVYAWAAASIGVREPAPSLAFLAAAVLFLIGAAAYPSVTLLTFMVMAASLLVLVASSGQATTLAALVLGMALLLRPALWPLLVAVWAVLAVSLLASPPSCLTRRYALVFAAIVAASALGEALNYASPGWSSYAAFNKARALVHDYGRTAIPPQGKADALVVFASWWPYDRDVLTDEEAIRGVAAGWSATLQRLDAAAIMQAAWQLRWSLAFLFVVAWLCRRRCRWPAWLVSTIGLAALAIGMSVLRGRYRATFGVLSSALVPLAAWARPLHEPLRRWQSALWAGLAAGVLLWGALAAPGLWHDLASRKSASLSFAASAKRMLGRELAARPDTRVATSINFPVSMGAGQYMFPMFEEDAKVVDFVRFIPPGWLARSPFFYRKLAEFGARDYHSAVTDPLTVFLGSRHAEGRSLMLPYFDKYWPGCAHRVETVNEDGNASLTRLVRDCSHLPAVPGPP
jgi:hypothetical protein